MVDRQAGVPIKLVAGCGSVVTSNVAERGVEPGPIVKAKTLHVVQGETVIHRRSSAAKLSRIVAVERIVERRAPPCPLVAGLKANTVLVITRGQGGVDNIFVRMVII